MAFFEDDAEAVRVGRDTLPPFVLPIGFTGRRFFGLHLHPSLSEREEPPVVSQSLDDATWGESAPSLATFAAQLLFLEGRRHEPGEELMRWGQRYRWATGRPPWTAAGLQPRDTLAGSPEAAIRAVGLGGGDSAAASLAGEPSPRREAWADAVRSHPKAFAVRLLAASDRSPLRDGRTEHLDAALRLPFYSAGSPAAHSAVLAKAKEAWDAGALFHPRVCLAFDYPDPASRYAEMLPGLAEAGAVGTLLEEAVNTGFLAGAYADAFPIAFEALRRVPDRGRLGPLFDLWAKAYV